MSNITKDAKPELSEKMVSTDVKQVQYSLKTPGEPLGTVVNRHSKKADYVPIENDPEMARMIQERGADKRSSSTRKR